MARHETQFASKCLVMLAALLGCDLQLCAGDEPCSPSIRLQHDDIEAGDLFGASVAWQGDLLLVGTIGMAPPNGGARLFDMSNPDDPVHIADLIAWGALYTAAGHNVAMNSTHAFIGGLIDDEWVGAVWVYDIRNPEKPVFVEKLIPPLTAGGPEFGDQIIATEEFVLISASYAPDTGRIYQYAQGEDGTFEVVQRIEPPAGTPTGIQFGRSMSLDEEWLVIGAPWHHVEGDPDALNGAIHFYKREAPSTFEWSHLLPAQSGDETIIHQFGEGVLIQDDLLFVFTFFYLPLNPTGLVSIFDVSDPLNPQFVSQIFPDDELEDFGADKFGEYMLKIGDSLVVSAVQSDVGGDDSGAVYIYDISDVRNPELDQLLLPIAQPDAWLGRDIAWSGSILTITGPKVHTDGDFAGAVYNYDDCTLPGFLPSDLDHNNVVDIRDLLLILRSFGTHGVGAALAHPVGVVDHDDLFELLSNWGREIH